MGQLIPQSQSLSHGDSRAQRAITDKNSLRIQMAFPVTSEFALDRAEFFKVVKSHPVESVLSSQGVNPVFGVARIVDKVVRLVPRPSFFHKHQPMNRGHDLGQSCRAAPVTGRSANHCMSIHQRDQSPRHHRIGQSHLIARSIFYVSGIFRPLRRGRR